MSIYRDNERLVIELGRALRKGEYKCKVHFLKLNDVVKDDFEKLPVLCEWIFRNGADVGSTKREIIAHLSTVDPKFHSLTMETCRLRKNGYRAPCEIYTDDMKFDDDIRLSESFEVTFLNHIESMFNSRYFVVNEYKFIRPHRIKFNLG